MRQADPAAIFWAPFPHGASTFYLAASEKGLLYISLGGSFEAFAAAAARRAGGARWELSPAALARPAIELDEYFRGRRRRFDIPLDIRGTAFEQDVWRAVSRIPYGQTRSYQDIAAAVGRPRALRAVGLANRRNPLPLVIPCHRVIGKQGQLTGYAGGLPLKAELLALEQTGAPPPFAARYP